MEKPSLNRVSEATIEKSSPAIANIVLRKKTKKINEFFQMVNKPVPMEECRSNPNYGNKANIPQCTEVMFTLYYCKCAIHYLFKKIHVNLKNVIARKR